MTILRSFHRNGVGQLSGRFWPNRPDVTSLWAKHFLEYIDRNLCHSIGIMRLALAKITNLSYFHRNGVSQEIDFGQMGRMSHHCWPNFYLSTSKRIYAIPVELCSWNWEQMTNLSYFYRNGVSQVANLGRIGRMSHHYGPNFYLDTLKIIYAIPFEICTWYREK